MDKPVPSESSDLQKPLEHFRAKTKRLQIHPTELWLLGIIGLHVVFLPWAIGGMRPWSQMISLILGIIGLVVALIPRRYTPEQSGVNNFRLVMWPRDTMASSKTTTSAGRPSARTSRQDRSADPGFAERLATKVVGETATRHRVRTNLGPISTRNEVNFRFTGIRRPPSNAPLQMPGRACRTTS